jgi:hypothetical protein
MKVWHMIVEGAISQCIFKFSRSLSRRGIKIVLMLSVVLPLPPPPLSLLLQGFRALLPALVHYKTFFISFE